MSLLAALARPGLLWGGSGSCMVARISGLHTALGRHQRLGHDPTRVTCEEQEDVKAENFSYFAPAPGKESSLRWAGKKYEEIPIVCIKATYNNTHIQVFTPEFVPLALATCGTEGFKNAKKSSTIAAQTTGIAAAAKAVAKGVVHVRVVVKGLGPGRLESIKGLAMGGLQIISITDNTPIPHNGCRPRKVRRL